MRKLLSTSVLAAFLLATPVSGATVSPATAVVSEPDVGFIRGINIEWNAQHMEMLPTDEHAAYHASLQADLDALHASYEGDVPMEELRAWMRDMAMEHRNWHQTHAPVDGGVVLPVVMVKLRNGEEVQAPPGRRFLRLHVRNVYQQSRSNPAERIAMTAKPLKVYTSNGYQRPPVERISRRTLLEQYKAQIAARALTK